MDTEYEYDVALSFCAQDEGIATQLHDLLQERFKTFLYSKKQEKLAGADGEHAFNAVFERKSRCVVVFYRKGWGETPFTRIEETAIKNRAFDHGYDFTVFVPMDKPPGRPTYVPKTRLYYALERFGLPGLAGAVEQRIQELGGEPRVEGALERAARSQRSRELSDAQAAFRDSPGGIDKANSAFTRLTSAMQELAAQIAGGNAKLSELKAWPHDAYWLVAGLGLNMTIQWRRAFINSLRDSVLEVELWLGVPQIPGLRHHYKKPSRLRLLEYEYQLLTSDMHGYAERKGDKRSFSAEALADELVRVYIDTCEKWGSACQSA